MLPCQSAKQYWTEGEESTHERGVGRDVFESLWGILDTVVVASDANATSTPVFVPLSDRGGTDVLRPASHARDVVNVVRDGLHVRAIRISGHERSIKVNLFTC